MGELDLVIKNDGSDDGPTLPEINYMKKVAEVLLKHYPDHLWMVHVSFKMGMCDVKNMRLSGEWGFRIKLSEIDHDPMMKTVIRAGGELLERYKLARGTYDVDVYSDLHEDFSGRLVADK